FTRPPSTSIYTLSLHDALPILLRQPRRDGVDQLAVQEEHLEQGNRQLDQHHRDDLPDRARLDRLVQHLDAGEAAPDDDEQKEPRSEEHTSELQSLAYLVCRLLL